MMVDRAAGQVDQLGGLGGDPRLSGLVRIADDRVGVGDVQVAPDQRDAEGMDQMVEQHRAQLGLAVAVRIAEQGDAHRPLRARAGMVLDPAHHQLLGPLDRFRRAAGLDHQHVAIGEHIRSARVLQPGREWRDRQPGGNRRRLARLPLGGGCHVHRRDKVLLRLGQERVGADLALRIAAAVAARGKHRDAGKRKKRAHQAATAMWRTRVGARSSSPNAASANTASSDRVSPAGTTDVYASRL